MGTIGGLILAGGKNSRMDGEKKLFLEYQGMPFYRRIAAAMEGLDGISLSVEAMEPYRQTGLALIADRFPGIGPMGGIYSGLMETEADALLVLPCDTPLVEKELVEALTEQFRKTGRPVFAADIRPNPLVGIYTKDMMPLMAELIGQNDYRMMHLLRRISYDTISGESVSCMLRNVNDKKSYEELHCIQEDV